MRSRAYYFFTFLFVCFVALRWSDTWAIKEPHVMCLRSHGLPTPVLKCCYRIFAKPIKDGPPGPDQNTIVTRDPWPLSDMESAPFPATMAERRSRDGRRPFDVSSMTIAANPFYRSHTLPECSRKQHRQHWRQHKRRRWQKGQYTCRVSPEPFPSVQTRSQDFQRGWGLIRGKVDLISKPKGGGGSHLEKKWTFVGLLLYPMEPLAQLRGGRSSGVN